MHRDKLDDRIYGILRKYQLGELDGGVRVGFLDTKLSAVLTEIRDAIDNAIKRNVHDRVRGSGIAV